MSEENSVEYKLVKLLIVSQVYLEMLDELKDTKVYRHNLKRSINNVTKDIETFLSNMYKHMPMDNSVEEAFLAIQRGVEVLAAADVDTLYNIGYKPLNTESK